MNTQKTIFITGTSSGLGRASTKLFSSQAWRVIATMRGQDAGKEAELKKLPGVKVLPLDVAEPAQIIDCESMAFELKRFGIGMKTIEPGGMKTDFFTRSFDTGRHAAYEGLVERVMDAIADPKAIATYSTPDQIAEVVYEAATDGKDQLRYVAGADAKTTYATRLQLGDEAFRNAMDQRFFG